MTRLRERVLAAWAAAPARFREDANAEEDLVRGGYRDRVVVELAQNAADAASRAGVAGVLRLTLGSGALRAANTGALLDPEGVEALCTLRASAKRGAETVGRFGVGFAAVLAVSDEPLIASTSGAVRWSRPLALACARDLAALHDELDRRGDAVPVLRLPFEAPGRLPPEGFATEVVLPLRDAAAEELVGELLAGVDAALLLTLPALRRVEIEVEGLPRRVLEASWIGPDVVDVAGARWRLVRAAGRLRPELLADRPVEERGRTAWEVTWAVPEPGGRGQQPASSAAAPVIHAPTPTDEPLGLPALLVASFPLEPSRRHVAPGPLTDFVVARAAEAYVEVLRAAADPRPLLPAGLPAGRIDGALRARISALLPDAAVLPLALGSEGRVRPRDAVAAELAELAPALAEVVPNLIAGPPTPALVALGVRPLALADVVEALAGLHRDARWWSDCYDRIAAAVPPGADREALAALPVPLADGGLAPGPRDVVLPRGDVDARLLTVLGLRVSAIAHPLLAALGAVPADPTALLSRPAVRDAVAASYDADDPAPVTAAVLTLVRAGGEGAPEPLLPDAEGQWAPASELLLPGGRLAALVDEAAPFGTVATDWVQQWGRGVLAAVGVLDTFAVLRAGDVPADGAELDLDRAEEWIASLPGADDAVPPVLADLTALRDLEWVADWDRALRLIADDPALRAAVVEPVRVLRASGAVGSAPSYTAWWLARHPVLAGRPPRELRLGDSDPLLAGLYDVAPPVADPAFLRAIGARTTLEAPDVLARLADPARAVGRAQLRALMSAVAEDAGECEPPARVRAVRDGRVLVVAADEAVVIDAPDLLPLVAGAYAVVPCPLSVAARLADLLDVALASELGRFAVTSLGEESPTPPAPSALLPGAPPSWWAHDPLLVDGLVGPIEARWRVVDGRVHAATVDGLARGLAWAVGRWEARHALELVLTDPDALPGLLAEADLDG